MTKVDLETMRLFIDRMSMYILPINQNTIKAFIHGLDVGRNCNPKWTDIISSYLHDKYKIEKKAMGWTHQIEVYAEQNHIDWVEAFRILMAEIIKE